MKSFSSLVALSFLVTGVAAAMSAACAGQVALTERPCPCSDGFTCCESRNVCVPEGNSCDVPGGQNGASSSGSNGSYGSSNDASASSPIELATGQSARCMATDTDHVYWGNADGLIMGNMKKGGNLQTSSLRTPDANNPMCGIAIDGDKLFTTSYSLGKVVELSLESSSEWNIGAVSGFFGTLTTPSSLSLDQDAVYVTEYEAGRVTKAPRSRAAQTVLAEGLTRPNGVHVVGAEVVFGERGAADTKTGAIKKVPKDGGQVVVLASGLDDVDGLAMWDGRAYWASKDGIYSVSLTGGDANRLARGTSPGGPVQTDGAYVYFTDLGRLSKSKFIGGEPIDWDTSRHTTVFVVDDRQAYWSDGARILVHYK
jgi:hypothetical protein